MPRKRESSFDIHLLIKDIGRYKVTTKFTNRAGVVSKKVWEGEAKDEFEAVKQATKMWEKEGEEK